MRPLLYRVVEAKVLRSETGFRVDAYLLIQGKGKPVHFDILTIAELPVALDRAVRDAYLEITGTVLSDKALLGPPEIIELPDKVAGG
jgi:hypothetical protein